MAQRYYHKNDVSEHDQDDDLWVSCNGSVYDLTSVVAEHKKNKSSAVKPMEDHAGQDVSHLFTKGDNGIEPTFPWDTEKHAPWWTGDEHVIGTLSETTTKIRIVNTLTKQTDVLEVPVEETLDEIQTRYEAFNANSKSYVWKALCSDPRAGQYKSFVPLSMNKTLAENGIKNYDAELKLHDLDPDNCTQAIHLYFADNLSIA